MIYRSLLEKVFGKSRRAKRAESRQRRLYLESLEDRRLLAFDAFKTDTLVVDNNTPGEADPGDTIEYSVVINNTDAVDATDVTFTDTLADSTLVPGSITVTPIAFDDAYSLTGNTPINVSAATGVLANDIDPDAVVPLTNTGLTAINLDLTGTLGTVTSFMPDGSFTYTPPAGFTGADTFHYTARDADNLDSLVTGTVTMTVSGMVWYVDNLVAGPGSGTYNDPFDDFSQLNGAGGDVDGFGDTIFVFGGAGTYGGIELENNQQLIGEGVGLSVNGMTIPAGSRPVFGNAGGNAITLAQNNTIRGLDIGTTAASSYGITGNTFGTLNVDNVDFAGGRGGGILNLNNGVVNAAFDNLRTSSSSVNAIQFNTVSGTLAVSGGTNITATGVGQGVNISSSAGGSFSFGDLDITTSNSRGLFGSNAGTVNSTSGTISTGSGVAVDIVNAALGLTLTSVSTNGASSGINLNTTTGSFTITGDGSTTLFGNASGGTIQNSTGNGVSLSNVSNVTLQNVVVSGSADQGIFGDNVTNFDLLNSDLSGNNDAPGEYGVYITNLLGAGGVVNSIVSSRVTGSNTNNVYIFNDTATSPGNAANPDLLTITGSTFSDLDPVFGSNGVLIESDTNGNVRVEVSGSTFTNLNGIGLALNGNFGGDLQSVVTTSSFTPGAGFLSTAIDTLLTGDSTHKLNWHDLGTVATDGTPLSITAFDDSSFHATIANNTIDQPGAFNFGEGIAVTVDAFAASGGNSFLDINNNTITRAEEGGAIGLRVGGGAAELDATVRNNTINSGPYVSGVNFPLSAFYAQSGTDPGDGSTLRLHLDNNTNNTSGDPASFIFDYELAQISGSNFILQNLGAVDGTNEAAVEGFIASTDTNAPGAPDVEVNSPLVFPAPVINYTDGTATLPMLPLLAAAGETSANAPGVAPTTDAGGGTTAPPSSGTITGTDDGIVSAAELGSIVDAAIERWTATGLSAAQIQTLQSATFAVRDLTGWYLGSATGSFIEIDSDGAGQGWFVDATPLDDAEFFANSTGSMTAYANGPAAGRMDLLTTVMHEMGHLLGIDDSYDAAQQGNLMYGYLFTSQRRLAAEGQADGAVAGSAASTDFLGAPIMIGTLPAGKSVEITFQVVIDNPFLGSVNMAGFGELFNQGNVTANAGAINIPTDDPDTVPLDDPTLTLVTLPQLVVDFAAGDLSITDMAGQDDDITLQFDSGTNEIIILDANDTLNASAIAGTGVISSPGEVRIDLDDIAFGPITSITVNGEDGDDTLTVDHTLGVNSIPINFHGGSNGVPGDRLDIVGGSFTSVEYTYTTANNGSINSDGTMISYTGLEPLTNTGTAADIIFNLPDVGGTPNSDAVLQNSANPNESELVGSTFENTVFHNPTGSLTINLGNQGDTLTINTLDGGFGASLIVADGTGADTVDIDSALTAGGVDITADNILIGANVTTTGGDQAYEGDVDFSGNRMLTAANINFRGGTTTFNGTNTTVNVTGVATSEVGNLLDFQDGQLILASGSQFVSEGNAQFRFGDGNFDFYGSGTFTNSGTFNHTATGGSDNLELHDSFTFVNAGTFDFQQRGDIRLRNSSVFNNSGLLVKSVAGSDQSFIFGASGDGGTFHNLAGGEVRGNAGTLDIATGNLGPANTSDPASIWTADGGDVQLGGLNVWEGTLNGTASGGRNVTIENNGNGTVPDDFQVGPAGVTFNITGNGVEWSDSNVDTNGNTLTNLGVFSVVAGTAKQLQGGGEFVTGTGGVTTLSDTVTSTGGSTMRVAGGGTLNGAGTFTGAVTVEGGGVVSPGTSPGILSTGDVVFDAASNLNVELDGTTVGTQYDQLNVSGNVNIDPAALLNLTLNFLPVGGTSFVIINDVGGTVTGEFSGFADGSTFMLTDTSSMVDVEFEIDYQANEVVITTTGVFQFDGTAGDDTLTINAVDADTANYTLVSDGVPTSSGVIDGVTQLIFNGLAGDDRLIINNPGGSLFNPIDGIVFDGGTGGEGSPGFNPLGDALEIVGGTATSVRHEFTNDHDGYVFYNGAGTPSITYTGLEPITDTVMAGDRTFTFTGGGETVTLSDDGDMGDGESKIDSSMEGEEVVFTNPTGLLTIDTTADADPDMIHLEGLDSLFNANLTVTGKVNDTVTSQTNATDIGAGNLNLTAGSIALNANVTTTGNADLKAYTGSITDNADDNTANLSANNVHLTLSSGGNTIGSSTADRLELNAATLQVTANSGGNAFLRDTAGGVALIDSSVTGAGTYDLEALNGNITSNVVDGTRDVGAGILVLTTTGGGSIGTGPADRLEINAATRFDATTAGGSVFVLDPNGSLPVGTISAPAATVDLLSTGGPITDANGASTNVTGNNLTANAATGINLDTHVNTITAATTAAGDITLREFDGVTLTNVDSNSGNVTITAGGTTNAVSVTAGGSGNVSITTMAGDINLTEVAADGDRVTLDAGGSILDASGAVTNITALEALLTAGSGIGSAMGNGAIDTMISFLEAAALGGGVWVANTGALTIGGITPGGDGVTATGTIEVSTASPMDVIENVISTGGPVTLTSGDSMAPGDYLRVHSTFTVRSDTSDVTLRAGDNLTLDDSSTVSAPSGQVVLLGDYGNADPEGSVMNLLGTITSSVQATATGGADNDIINVNPGLTHSIDSILLDGAGGDDMYFVQLGRLDGPVNVSDTGVGDNDTATVSGTADGEDFTVHNNEPNDGSLQTGGFVTRNTPAPVQTVNYTQTLEHLEVLGGDGQDTLHVQPSQTAEITINGGSPIWGFGPGDVPQVGDGDVLDFDPLGNTFVINGKTILTDGGNPNPFQGVTFISIESLPLTPLGGETQQYDFDYPDGSPATAPGFTSVLTTQIYGSGTPGSDFGWDAMPQGFVTSLADPLLKDMHYGTTAARTFSTDITNGWYLVSVDVGVSTSSIDNMQISAEGIPVVADIDTPDMQFVQRSFVVEVKDGTLDLEFSDADLVDPVWVINGLEIRPAVILTLGIVPPAGPLEADGVTVDNFGGVNATPNAQITVATSFGTIVSADVNPLLAGVQVMADAMGQYNFDVLRPSTGGEALVTAEETTGAATGCVLVTYTTPNESHFDFNSGGSPTATDYTGVGDVNAFDPVLGYGWQSTADTIARTGPTALLRDGHYSTTNNTFTVNVNNGSYTVNVTLGDALVATGPVDVFAEGAQKLDDVSTAAGQFVHRSFQVDVLDGQLDLQLVNDGGTLWELNALDIILTQAPITITNLGGPVDADGMTIDAFNATGAAGSSLVTVTTDFGTITNADADPNYAGIQVQADGGGNFTINVQRPFVAGTATITAEAVNAASAGSTTQEYVGGGGLRFDLNAAGTPTAMDFIGIGTTNQYDPLLGFGWQTTAPTFSSAGPNDLLRDFHYGTTTNTFLVDIADGDYVVNVTLGYNSVGFDNVDVNAEGLGPQLTGLGSTAGQFIHRSFPVTVTGGQLDIVFTDTGGSAFFPVDAIEILPAPVGVQTLMGPTMVEADGMTVDMYTGTGATPSSLITISTTLGTPTGPDASAAYAGIQVMSDGAGNFNFEILRPNLPGNAVITAEEVSAASIGTLAVTYEASSMLQFDFNHAGTLTAAGYTGVGIANAFSPMTGYGWTTNAPTFAAAGPDTLLQDFSYGTTSNTFVATVEMGATYMVTARFHYIIDVIGFDIVPEGGATVDEVSVPANTPTTDVFLATDVNNDGLLEITFNADGAPIFMVSALEYVKQPLLAAVAPAEEPTTALLTGDELSPIVAEAISRWATVLPIAAQTLTDVDVQIADLSGGNLGLASDNAITIDADAAGYGWFVDATPGDDVEFDAAGQALGGDAALRFDLLTVVMHEFGHVLGYDDLEESDLDPDAAAGSLMSALLPLGTRREPSSVTTAVDSVFTQAGAEGEPASDSSDYNLSHDDGRDHTAATEALFGMVDFYADQSKKRGV